MRRRYVFASQAEAARALAALDRAGGYPRAAAVVRNPPPGFRVATVAEAAQARARGEWPRGWTETVSFIEQREGGGDWAVRASDETDQLGFDDQGNARQLDDGQGGNVTLPAAADVTWPQDDDA